MTNNSYINGINAIKKRSEALRKNAFNEGVADVKSLSRKEQFIAGLMLYWAEGSKTRSAAVSNSDPRLIKFMVTWFHEFFGIPLSSMRIHLHLHTGQDENKIKRFWTNLTKIPSTNFDKTYIKPEKENHGKRKLYFGTAKIRVVGTGSTYLIYKIMGGIANFLKSAINIGYKETDWLPINRS